MLGPLEHALLTAAFMGWEILWALVLGFFISGVIQAVVSHSEMAKLLPDAKPRTIVKASLLGAASSSLLLRGRADHAVDLRNGGDFTAAIAFEFASTKLVAEPGILMALLLGWRFTAATWGGGIVMVILLVVLMRLFVGRRLPPPKHHGLIGRCWPRGERLMGNIGEIALTAPKDGRDGQLRIAALTRHERRFQRVCFV